jgi:hypothetical protein
MLGGPAPLPNVIEAAIERGVPLGVFIPQTTALLTALGHDRVAAVVIGPVAHRDVAVAFWTSVLGPPRVSGTAAIFAVPRAVTFP